MVFMKEACESTMAADESWAVMSAPGVHEVQCWFLKSPTCEVTSKGPNLTLPCSVLMLDLMISLT